jgi:hypothetical protein
VAASSDATASAGISKGGIYAAVAALLLLGAGYFAFNKSAADRGNEAASASAGATFADVASTAGPPVHLHQVGSAHSEKKKSAHAAATDNADYEFMETSFTLNASAITPGSAKKMAAHAGLNSKLSAGEPTPAYLSSLRMFASNSEFDIFKHLETESSDDDDYERTASGLPEPLVVVVAEAPMLAAASGGGEEKAAKPKGATATLSTANGAKLGMKLESEVPGAPNGLSIKRLVPGGQAETNGKIKVGMVIHTINGKDIRMMTRPDAMVVLKEAGETIKLTFMPTAADLAKAKKATAKDATTGAAEMTKKGKTKKGKTKKKEEARVEGGGGGASWDC